MSKYPQQRKEGSNWQGTKIIKCPLGNHCGEEEEEEELVIFAKYAKHQVLHHYSSTLQMQKQTYKYLINAGQYTIYIAYINYVTLWIYQSFSEVV